MKRYYQTDTTGETGNCLQYAVASLFEIDPVDVPRFNPTDWLADVIHFCNEQSCIVIPSMPYIENLTPKSKGPQVVTDTILRGIAAELHGYNCLLGVRSFHGRWGHAVVGRIGVTGSDLFTVIHDPNRGNFGRPTSDYVITDVDFIIPQTKYAADLIREFETV